jgi:hypothetical protein
VYYLYSKAKKGSLPKFDYTFNKFEDFYAIGKILTRKLDGLYEVNIKANKYDEVMEFINISEQYWYLNIYITMAEPLLDRVLKGKPAANTLSMKDDYEVWTDLIQKYNILFDKGCIKKIYWSIKHDYDTMTNALTEIKSAYGDRIVTMKMVEKVIQLDDFVYPRSVCISYVKMDRFRRSRLNKSVQCFGSDLVYYAMRKNVTNLLEAKMQYFKTGNGNNLIKALPMDNLVKLNYAFIVAPSGFKDIYTLLNLYEKGVYLDDYLQERTF